jgi:CubicO group peptidase (beta-lactamase class C family)
MTAQDIREQFDSLQSTSRAPDLAFGVSVEGELVDGEQTEHQFRIASMTKSFTAAAVLLLRDRGLLSLDAPIGNVVPELADITLPTRDSPQISVRDLLMMSSGLATDDPWADRQMDISQQTMDGIMRDGGYFAWPVGTNFVYSNYGYAILGRVVANISREPFATFVENELLQPLGLQRTSWHPVEPFVRPHRLQDDQVVLDSLEPLKDGAFSPLGGIWSTVGDLLSWAQFLMNGFPARDGSDDEPLRRSTRREMQQMHRYDFGGRFAPRGVARVKGAGYGMGLIVLDDPELGHIVMHPGGLPGYGSCMAWLPHRRTAVVGLANLTYTHVWSTCFAVLDSLHRNGELPAAPQLRVPLLEQLAERLISLLNDWSDDVAGALFADNVVLDLDYERRRRAVEPHGKLLLESIEVTSAATATGKLRTEDGVPLELTFSLSPQRTPKIQAYSIREQSHS